MDTSSNEDNFSARGLQGCTRLGCVIGCNINLWYRQAAYGFAQQLSFVDYRIPGDLLREFAFLIILSSNLTFKAGELAYLFLDLEHMCQDFAVRIGL